MLVQLGDHGLEDWGLSLLTEVDPVFVHFLLLSHLKVGQLERLITILAFTQGFLLV